MKLTLGMSPCPNDTFIFDALLHGRIDTGDLNFEPVIEDVETLNEMAAAGKLDITKLSYHAFGKVTRAYILLNAGSALGNGCGPLLIAREPIPDEAIASGRVAIPGLLTTAHFLFGLEYPDTEDKLVLPFDAIEDAVLSGRADAGVIIHENRFTYASRGLVKLCDLGARWERSTGCPIPLGGIAARRDLPDDVAARCDRLIRDSVRYAFDHPDASAGFVRSHAQEMDVDVMRQHIDLYVNHFTEDLGAEGRKAIEVLMRRAESAGLIESPVRPFIR